MNQMTKTQHNVHQQAQKQGLLHRIQSPDHQPYEERRINAQAVSRAEHSHFYPQ